MFSNLRHSFYALLLLVLAMPAQASWMEARQLVESATQEMVDLLTDPSLKQEESFDRLLHGVEGVLTPVVDFDRIARGVMAKYYRQASDEQRERFAKVFKSTLIKTYAKALASFNLDRYQILENRQPSSKPRKQLVQVMVVGSDGKEYQLVYYVLQSKAGDWKVTNVHLDGINLRQIFRNQFANAVSNNQGDIDRVISDWSELADSEPARGNS